MTAETATETRFKRWERALSGPLTLSAFAFLAAYAWPILDTDLAPHWRHVCTAVTWTTWALLVVDLAIRFGLAENRWAFIRKNPVDIASAALPVLRPLRLLQLVTMLNALNRIGIGTLRGRIGLYLTGSVTLIVFVGSLAMLNAERGHKGPIQTFGDSLWWAMTTITTVGYGDTYPVTTTGRLIAVGVMVAGIAVLGTVTGMIASWVVDQVSANDDKPKTPPAA